MRASASRISSLSNHAVRGSDAAFTSGRTSSSGASRDGGQAGGGILGWFFPKRKLSVTEQRRADILKRKPSLEENAWGNGWGPEAPLPEGLGAPPPRGADVVVRNPEEERPLRRKLFTSPGSAGDKGKPYDC